MGWLISKIIGLALIIAGVVLKVMWVGFLFGSVLGKNGGNLILFAKQLLLNTLRQFVRLIKWISKEKRGKYFNIS